MVRTQLVKLYSYLKSVGVPEVRILDLELEFGRPVDEAELRRFLDRTVQAVGAAPYDFIGISCYTSVNYTATLEVVCALRSVQPDAIVAVGGYHALSGAEEFASVAAIDYVVQGDGVGFLQAILQRQVLPRVASFPNSVSDPDRMLWDEYPYRYRREPAVAHVQLSRGCPYTCSFCSEPFIGNSRYVPLQVDEALQEIDDIIRVYDPDKVLIEDLIFGLHVKWRHDFLEALRDRRYRQIFWLEMRVDTLTVRTLELMAQANIDLTVGLESLSAGTLMRMSKASHPEHYIASFRKAAQWSQRYGVPTTFTIMLNYPGDKLENFHETMANIDVALDVPSSTQFRFDFLEYSFYPGNETFAQIDRLHEEYGTEVGDRQWYTRRDGTMLEQALCTVASSELRRQVGDQSTASYFRGRVARVEHVQEAKRALRSHLIWNYSFVCRLQRHVAAIRGLDLFCNSPNLEAREAGLTVRDLGAVQAGLAEVVAKSLTRERPLSWPLRVAAWEAAFEWVSGAAAAVGWSDYRSCNALCGDLAGAKHDPRLVAELTARADERLEEKAFGAYI